MKPWFIRFGESDQCNDVHVVTDAEWTESGQRLVVIDSAPACCTFHVDNSRAGRNRCAEEASAKAVPF